MTRKILLVDNDKFFRKLIGSILTDEGYNVTTVSDGIDVLEKIGEIKPDGIILDLIMDTLDGDQVIKFLKRNKEYRNLPIIVLSGLVSEKNPNLKDIEADIFIPKSEPEVMKVALIKNLRTLFKESSAPLFTPTSDEPLPKEMQDTVIFELLNKSKNLQVVLDNLTEGILASDEEAKINYCNLSLQKILGLNVEHILGRDLREFLVFLNAHSKTIDDIFKHKGHIDKTKIYELFHGEKILKLKSSYFKKENQYGGVLIVFSDMTEQRNLEKKMEAEYQRKTKELENTYKEIQKTNLELIKASEIKSQFVANVSHELRSPLNDIMGFVQLLQAKIYGPTTQKQDEALLNVMQNSNSLLKMINEILDLSKLDKDEMPVMTTSIHPRELIEQVIGSYSWIGNTKQVDVQVFYSDDLPTIKTDDTKLRRILLNLLDNAVKFTEKGRVHLKVENLPEEKMILFTVEDTGIGISEEDKEIIFQPFRQVDGSTTRKYGGVGLGLYIVKKLVEMINGTMRLESKLGSGTKFFIKIPYSIKEDL